MDTDDQDQNRRTQEMGYLQAVIHECKMTAIGSGVVTLVSWIIGLFAPKAFAFTYFTVIIGMIGFLSFLDEHEFPQRQSKKIIAVRGLTNALIQFVALGLMALLSLMFLDEDRDKKQGVKVEIQWSFGVFGLFALSVVFVLLLISWARAVTFIMIFIYRMFE